VIVLAREDVEVHLHALQTMNEQFLLCVWGHCRLGKVHHCSEMSESWDAITQPVHVLPCHNLTMKDNNGTDRILHHDIAAQTITEPSPCFTVGTRHSGVQTFLAVLQT
jgi:hypothetical protein